MSDRSGLKALLFAGLLFPLASCGNDPSLTSIVVNPSTVTTTMSNGLQAHFSAIGYYTHPGHPAVTKDITTEVTWTSAMPQMVTINNAGVATVTGQTYGSTSIYASAPGFNGDIIGSANFIVQSPTAYTDIVLLSIAPTAYTLASLGATEPFIATGTTASGSEQIVTTESVWISNNTGYATIGANTGIATAVGVGTATIQATYTNSDGTTAVGTATLTVQ